MDYFGEDALNRDREMHFLGLARIRLKYLRFEEDGQSGGRLLDHRNVDRLVRVFKLSGCQRHVPAHSIPVIISEDDLEAALAQRNISRDDLLNARAETARELVPLPNTTLTCPHGRHRVHAAKEFLPLHDQWWLADLFSSKLQKQTRLSMRYHYTNSRNISHGELFRHILLCRLQDDETGAHHWIARLSPSLQKTVRQLKKNQALIQAFIKLLPFIGLWPALQLGSMPTILSLRCQEECISYLNHISRTWSDVVGNSDDLKCFVDGTTVERLQCRAPQSYDEDADFVKKLMDDKAIFSRVISTEDRQNIMKQLLLISRMIPSLHTFGEDFKFLALSAKAMKSLIPDIPPKSKRSLQEAFEKIYIGINQDPPNIFIEDDEGDYSITTGEPKYQGYIQLWLYSIRHFSDLINARPKKEPNRATPIIKQPDPNCWRRFAILARHLGFNSTKIQALLDGPEPQLQRTSSPQMTRPDDPGRDMSRRCGIPFELSYEYDKGFLFLRRLDGLDTSGRQITSLLVKRDILSAFFPKMLSESPSMQSYHDVDMEGHGHIPEQVHDENMLVRQEESTVSPVSSLEVINTEVFEVSTPSESFEKLIQINDRPPVVEDFLHALRQLKSRCIAENKVAFVPLSKVEYCLVENIRDVVNRTANKISTGEHDLVRGNQRVGSVFSGFLRAIDPSKAHTFANRPASNDYQLIIFCDNESRPRPAVFGISFEDYCIKLWGQAKGVKRMDMRANSSPNKRT